MSRDNFPAPIAHPSESGRGRHAPNLGGTDDPHDHLSTAALLGLALRVPTCAQAAAETCRGLPATIVGADNQRLVGTEGPDVVVTNGAQSLSALGGDDTICVTGTPVTAGQGIAIIDAGAGDDYVEASVQGRGTTTVLGAGADTFISGNGAEHSVHTGTSPLRSSTDTEADTVLITLGNASVTSGQADTDNPDTVEINRGIRRVEGTDDGPAAVDGDGRPATPRARRDPRLHPDRRRPGGIATPPRRRPPWASPASPASSSAAATPAGS